MDTLYSGHPLQWTPSTVDTLYSGTSLQWNLSTVDTLYSGHPLQWNLSTVDTLYSGHPLQWNLFTVEPLYSGHPLQWTALGPSWLCCIEVSLIQRWIGTQLYVVGVADSVLIKEVSFIQSVLYRAAPLYTHIQTMTECTDLSSTPST